MAHCLCLNGHDMWNGDGKPIVYVFRVDLLKEFTRKHPTFRLGFDYDGSLLDCMGEYPDEDLNCWYCDECRSLTIFIDSLNIRYDFTRTDVLLKVKENDVLDWSKYIVLRDEEFERFMDFYEGMTPDEAIEKFAFPYSCRISPDWMHIHIFEREGNYQFGFEQKRVKRIYLKQFLVP